MSAIEMMKEAMGYGQSFGDAVNSVVGDDQSKSTDGAVSNKIARQDIINKQKF